MLITLAAGALPSNRTLPRTAALLAVGAGPPALIACSAETQTAIVRTKIETIFFNCITSPLFNKFTNFVPSLCSFVILTRAVFQAEGRILQANQHRFARRR